MNETEATKAQHSISNDGKLMEFADIIDSVQAAKHSEPAPLPKPAGVVSAMATPFAPGTAIKRAEKAAPVAAAPTVEAIPVEAIPAQAPQRNAKGQFQGASVAQQAQSDAKDTQRAGEEKKTLIQSIKDGFKTVGGHAAGAVKDGAQSVDTKEAAGQAAGGPLYSAAKELYGAGQDIKEKAQDETTLLGKTWKGIKSKTGIGGGKKDAVVAELKAEEGKEVSRHKELLSAVKSISVTGGSQKGAEAKRLPKGDKGTAKGKPLKVPKEKPTLKKAMSRTPDGKFNIRAPKTGGTPVAGGGGGIVGDMLGAAGGGIVAKAAAPLLSKIPFLGKLFPSLAGTVGAAGTVAAEAAPVVGAAAGTAVKAGGGLLKAVGGRIPLIGGAISAGATLMSGGSKTEAAGSGIGAVAGAALGSIGGPIGTIAGGFIGEFVGRKLGGLFTGQNSKQSDLLSQQATQQAGFFSQLASSVGSLVTAVKDKAQAAGSAYSVTRERGGGFIESAAAGVKGLFRSSKGKANERETALEQAAVQSGMTDPKELAMFMGQAKHETAGFNTMTEYASGSAYEGRKDLGNTQAGDGKKFKGRGYFQLTGRANYADMSKKLGVDLENNPELAEDPKIASQIALQYWKDKKLDKAAQAGDFDTVTKRINGGTNGYEDRLNQTQSFNTKYANGIPGTTPKTAATSTQPSYTPPGTPQYAAMQAKFIADQQTTPLQQTTSVMPSGLVSTSSKKRVRGRNRDTEAVAVAAKPEEPKTLKPEDKPADPEAPAVEAKNAEVVSGDPPPPAPVASSAPQVEQIAAAQAEPTTLKERMRRRKAIQTATAVAVPQAVEARAVGQDTATAAIGVAANSTATPILPPPPRVQPPPPAPVASSAPQVEQIAAAIVLAMQQNQQANAKKEGTTTITQASIKTEFDDTMLTLMAYDRV